MGKKKSSQQTESLDKLHRIRLSGHLELKHPQVNIDAAPVLMRFALKQRSFNH